MPKGSAVLSLKEFTRLSIEATLVECTRRPDEYGVNSELVHRLTFPNRIESGHDEVI
jgi:hypothetical protein